jgi:hypothetical protein
MDEMINVSLKWDDAFLILKQLEYRLDDFRQLYKKSPDDPFLKERLAEFEKITESFSLATGIRRFI